MSLSGLKNFIALTRLDGRTVYLRVEDIVAVQDPSGGGPGSQAEVGDSTGHVHYIKEPVTYIMSQLKEYET